MRPVVMHLKMQMRSKCTGDRPISDQMNGPHITSLCAVYGSNTVQPLQHNGRSFIWPAQAVASFA